MTEYMRVMPASWRDKVEPFPMDLLRPHEAQAIINHGQTLDQLNQRDGLCPVEVLAIIEGWNPWILDNLNRETLESVSAKLTLIIEKELT